MVKSLNTEEKILEAARDVFVSRGFDGARMQDIADKAQINKALLHYYFRSKERLFKDVFKRTLDQIGPVIFDFVNEQIPLEVKIWKFVDNYIEIIRKNPKLPLFLLNEMSVNPERVLQYLNFDTLVNLDAVQDQLDTLRDKSGLSKIDARHFIVNVISMTIFPFLGKSIIQRNFKILDKDWDLFLEERKRIIPETIMSWIRFDQKV